MATQCGFSQRWCPMGEITGVIGVACMLSGCVAALVGDEVGKCCSMESKHQNTNKRPVNPQ